MPSTVSFTQQLQRREAELDQQINTLERQIEKLQQQKEAIRTLRGAEVPSQTRIQTYTAPQRIPVAAKKTAAKKAAKKGVKSSSDSGLSGMDMARQVIDQARTELSPSTIGDAIRKRFRTNPPSSLYQMLYKRARANSSFYRMPDGKFGLLEWKNRK